MADAPTLQHYPGLNMARYGLNPYEEPLYRIVFAPSRWHMVGGEWADGHVGARMCLLGNYRAMGNQWILEKWQSPEDYLASFPGGRAGWEAAMAQPAPSRGEYVWAFTFEACDPANANIDKLISWVILGKRATEQDILDGCRADAAASRKADDSQVFDKIWDKIEAFPGRPISAPGGNRGTKTREFPLGAPDGLPKPGSIKVGTPALTNEEMAEYHGNH